MSTPNHPITEFAFLHLVPPTTLQTPELTSRVLEATIAQPTWSGYPLHLFFHQSPSDEPNASDKKTSMYIISGWESVEAHYKWIASQQNQELMSFFRDASLLRFGGLAHLDIDFTKLDFKKCSQIIWRKRGANDAGSWDDASSWGKGQSGLEGGKEARVLWSRRGRALDKDVEDEYELVGFSDGVLPVVKPDYTVLQRWSIEA
jgi:hypothetical protein